MRCERIKEKVFFLLFDIYYVKYFEIDWILEWIRTFDINTKVNLHETGYGPMAFALQRKFHLCIPKKGIARPQSQFPH